MPQRSARFAFLATTTKAEPMLKATKSQAAAIRTQDLLHTVNWLG
jgi:hypothetical protein